MFGELCTVCEQDARGEFTCRGCGYSIHFICALGFDPPPQLKNSRDKTEYLCPVCVAGSSYRLLHMAIDAHSREWDTRDRSVGSHSDRDAARDADSSSVEHASVGDPAAGPTSPIAHHPNSTQRVHLDASAGVHDRAIETEEGETGMNNHTVPRLLTPLESTCETKAKKLSYVLSNNKTIPKHATTLVLGDSLIHFIDKRDFDCSDSLRVRGVGGLCVFAFVRALKMRERPLGNVKRLILSIGVNDYLHRAKHCPDDTSAIFSFLGTETKRVFPNASVFFVLPYKGITKMPSEERNELQKLIKTHCKKFKVFNPPSLENMVNGGGVHPSNKGAKLLTDFYRKLVPVPPRPISQDSGRQGQHPTWAAAAGQPPARQDQRNAAPLPPPPGLLAAYQHRGQRGPAPPTAYRGQPGPPSNTGPPTGQHVPPDGSDHNHNFAWSIASAVVSALQVRDYELMYPK